MAVSGHHREVSREDVNRATEVARAVSIPSNREVLHVLPRGFIVDGQEGVKDPLGMSAIRLEVETHIVTASATAVQNLTKCVAAAGVKIDELVVGLARLGRGGPVRDREGARRGGRRHGRRHDRPRALPGRLAVPHRVLPVGGNNVTNDVAIGLKTSLQVAEELKIRHGTCDLRSVDDDELISVAVLGEDAGRTVSRLECRQIIEARMRETLRAACATRSGRPGSGCSRPGSVLTGGASQLAGAAELGREVLEMPVRVAGTDGRRRPGRHAAHPGLQHGHRAAPVGRRVVTAGRAEPLRLGSGGRRDRPAAGRAPEPLPVERAS